MLPNPLHPAVVHFPLVLAFLLPVFAIAAIWAIGRGARARRAWSIPLTVALALATSAWVAVETGEEQEERVEDVVTKQPLHSHKELAEVLLASSAVLVVIAAGGLVGGLPGRSARIATAVGSVVLLVVAVRVGHSGGQLVYKYGAANAYTSSSAAGSIVPQTAQPGGRGDRGDRGDRESGQDGEHR
jgi:uncharacterized membrane protein